MKKLNIVLVIISFVLLIGVGYFLMDNYNIKSNLKNTNEVKDKIKNLQEENKNNEEEIDKLTNENKDKLDVLEVWKKAEEKLAGAKSEQ